MTPELAEHVFARDKGCMAPVLDSRAGACHDQWGTVINRRGGPERRGLTLQHVTLEPGGKKGDRARSDKEHLLVLCWGHHEGRGEHGGFVWATTEGSLNRQRVYLVGLASIGRA